MKDVAEIITALDLQPLAGEGGMWAPIFNNGAASAIYFLIEDPDFSAWHRIPEQEMWIHVAGSPTILYTYDEGGECLRQNLDNSSLAFQTVVKPYQWMAARSAGPWSLVICALTPAFTGMELATRQQVASWQIEGFSDQEIMGLLHE